MDITDAMVEAAAKELLAHGEFSSIPGNNEPNARIAARAALTAAIGAGGQAVAVKPLEWAERSGTHYADTAFGEACVGDDDEGFYVIESGRKHSGFGSADAAKAFVQKHHDIWVKDWLGPSALSQLHPADERVVVALREDLRQSMLKQTISGDRETYSDGFSQGLCFVIERLDALSAKEARS